MTRNYRVAYRMDESDDVNYEFVDARNKYDAYDEAVYEIIPKYFGGAIPYSAWVEAVRQANGEYHEFIHAHEGNRYGEL